MAAHDHLFRAMESAPTQGARAPWTRYQAALARVKERVAVVLVTASPPNARVILDGRPLGSADGRAFAVEPGTHTIGARLPGYADQVETRTVRARDVPTIHFQLTPIAPAVASTAAGPRPERPSPPPRPFSDMFVPAWSSRGVLVGLTYLLGATALVSGGTCTRQIDRKKTLCSSCQDSCLAGKPYKYAECYQCGFNEAPMTLSIATGTHVAFEPHTAETLSRLGAVHVVRASDRLLIGPSRRDPGEHARAREEVLGSSDEEWDQLYSPRVRWQPPIVVWVSASIEERVNLWRTLHWLRRLGLSHSEVIPVEMERLPRKSASNEPQPPFDCDASVSDHPDQAILDRLGSAHPWPRGRFDRAARLWETYVDRLAQWAAHGESPALERTTGPRPDVEMNAFAYRLTARGARILERGLDRVTDGPVLPIAGVEAYSESGRWVVREDGALAPFS